MARVQIMKKSYDVESGVATLAFMDGQKIEIELAKLSDAIVRQAALHGLLQKVGDAAAGEGDDPEKAFESCMAVFERLGMGDWKKATEKGEGARPTMVIEAVFRALQKQGKQVELSAVQTAFGGEDGEEKRKAILKDPRVKLEYEDLRAEAAAKRREKIAKEAEAAGSGGLDSLAL